MGTHPIFESDFDCLTESKMKLFAFSCLASAALAKDIKQRMMENRLKFDRDVVITGDLEDDEEWDPWDLEDEELQARLRKLVARMDHNRDGFVDTEELTSKFLWFSCQKHKKWTVWSYVSVLQLDSEFTTEEFHFADENKDNLLSWDEIIEDRLTILSSH